MKKLVIAIQIKNEEFYLEENFSDTDINMIIDIEAKGMTLEEFITLINTHKPHKCLIDTRTIETKNVSSIIGSLGQITEEIKPEFIIARLHNNRLNIGFKEVA